MKLINYKCPSCASQAEVLFNDTEEIPEKMECPCGTQMDKFNFKNNSHRVHIFDPSTGTKSGAK